MPANAPTNALVADPWYVKRSGVVRMHSSDWLSGVRSFVADMAESTCWRVWCSQLNVRGIKEVLALMEHVFGRRTHGHMSESDV
jgi:hypothetical protein